jgi:hypothetical protein
MVDGDLLCDLTSDPLSCDACKMKTVAATAATLFAVGLAELLEAVYDFRNTYVAHIKDELADRAKAEEALHRWIDAIRYLSAAQAAVAS